MQVLNEKTNRMPGVSLDAENHAVLLEGEAYPEDVLDYANQRVFISLTGAFQKISILTYDWELFKGSDYPVVPSKVWIRAVIMNSLSFDVIWKDFLIQSKVQLSSSVKQKWTKDCHVTAYIYGVLLLLL